MRPTRSPPRTLALIVAAMQYLVAAIVAVSIVDDLEVVGIDHEECASSNFLQVLADEVGEGAAIEARGEPIGRGQDLQLLVGNSELSDADEVPEAHRTADQRRQYNGGREARPAQAIPETLENGLRGDNGHHGRSDDDDGGPPDNICPRRARQFSKITDHGASPGSPRDDINIQPLNAMFCGCLQIYGIAVMGQGFRFVHIVLGSVGGMA